MGAAMILLVWAALHDLAARTVPNALSLCILILGLGVRAIDHSILLGVAAALMMFALLFLVWRAGAVGGGDVKLWAAAVLLVPPGVALEVSFLTRILLAGGVLAVVYLLLSRVVRRPRASRAGSIWQRVLRVEAWRISHKGPLPYAFAIASGAIFTLWPLSFQR